MSILQANVSIVYKVSDLSFNGDGSADIRLARIASDAAGNINVLGFKKVHVRKDEVNLALDAAVNGSTNRLAIANMIYKYLVNNSIVPGTIIA